MSGNSVHTGPLIDRLKVHRNLIAANMPARTQQQSDKVRQHAMAARQVSEAILRAISYPRGTRKCDLDAAIAAHRRRSHHWKPCYA
jgi:hypothetical protein